MGLLVGRSPAHPINERLRDSGAGAAGTAPDRGQTVP